jgi:ERCC4-type nuclease
MWNFNSLPYLLMSNCLSSLEYACIAQKGEFYMQCDFLKYKRNKLEILGGTEVEIFNEELKHLSASISTYVITTLVSYIQQRWIQIKILISITWTPHKHVTSTYIHQIHRWTKI